MLAIDDLDLSSVEDAWRRFRDSGRGRLENIVKATGQYSARYWVSVCLPWPTVRQWAEKHDQKVAVVYLRGVCCHSLGLKLLGEAKETCFDSRNIFSFIGPTPDLQSGTNDAVVHRCARSVPDPHQL